MIEAFVHSMDEYIRWKEQIVRDKFLEKLIALDLFPFDDPDARPPREVEREGLAYIHHDLIGRRDGNEIETGPINIVIHPIQFEALAEAAREAGAAGRALRRGFQMEI